MHARSYRESHLEKGADYHASFLTMPHRAMVWRLERKLVLRIVRKRFPRGIPAYLDFACGTGRLLALVSPIAGSATGVDVSASMLRVARETVKDVELIETDITRDSTMGNRRFDVITAFRFFPNAEAQLRREALAALRQHLAPTGILIFNNHLNNRSLLRKVMVATWLIRAGGRPDTNWGMSRADARELVAGAELEVEEEHTLAVLPFTDRYLPRPLGAVEALESGLARMGWFSAVAQHLIYVCSHRR